MAVWRMAEFDPDSLQPELLKLVGGFPLLADLLVRRGCATPAAARAFLDMEAYTPAAPEALPDMTLAVELLQKTIEAHGRILIWGDFDADGQTATALLLDALSPLTEVRAHIPDRVADSHGVGVDMLETRLNADDPALLLTCDTGITAFAAVDLAKARGVPTIITDHHTPEGRLPAADAVVNPHRLPPDHPLAGLPGVGVAYMLVRALYSALGKSAPDALLDLVALGIVADLAPLTGDTRYLLQRGLAALRASERLGVRALCESANLKRTALTAEEIAFQIAPRLNAAGRLGSAFTSVRLLTAPDRKNATLLAQQLDSLNLRRRALQTEVQASAEAVLRAHDDWANRAALVLYDPTWHSGVLGPVAGRLAERYGKPAILLNSSSAEPNRARGSARSAAGIDLLAALNKTGDLLTTWGGHAGAAGVSLSVASIAAFRDALDRAIPRGQQAEPPLMLDGELPLPDATPEFAAALDRFAPFGEGNPAPVFHAGGLLFHRSEFLDRAHDHRLITLLDRDGHPHFLYWWNSGESEPPAGYVEIAYTVGLKGEERQVVMTLVALRQVAPTEQLSAEPERQIIDLRAMDLAAALAQAKAEYPNLQIWSEGLPKSESAGVMLHELTPGAPLLIYTAPHSAAHLAVALDRTQSKVIVLVGMEPPKQDNIDAALTLLAGVIVAVVNKREGHIPVRELYARLALPESLVRAMLRYLVEVGWMDAPQFPDAESVQFAAPHKSGAAGSADLLRHPVARAFEEVRAYRVFFRTAPIESIFG